uniref:Uncharacterized protein n=1 Tax=Pygocentrus nattereri TaxID=42514 RepID=A0A3B4C248_PYGNA
MSLFGFFPSPSSLQDQIRKDFLLSDPKKDGAVKYLEKIVKVVTKHNQKRIALKKVEKYKFRIGSFKDTSYRKEPDLLEEWEQFYLPDHMKMEVIGFLEEFPCNADSAQLVLMVCEDGKVFAYEDERLHLVANDLKELFEHGVQFPGAKYYYRGQSFEDMVRKITVQIEMIMSSILLHFNDLLSMVKQSEAVIASTKEHQDMVKRMKTSYLQNLEIIKQRQQGVVRITLAEQVLCF